MTSPTAYYPILFFFSTLPFFFFANAQDRAPHGLAYENPIAFPPSAVNFFHPNTQDPNAKNPCEASNCSPLPLAAQVESNLAYESKETAFHREGSLVGVGGIVGIVFGFVLVALLGMGVYYVAVTHRANSSRANSILPDA